MGLKSLWEFFCGEWGGSVANIIEYRLIITHLMRNHTFWKWKTKKVITTRQFEPL